MRYPRNKVKPQSLPSNEVKGREGRQEEDCILQYYPCFACRAYLEAFAVGWALAQAKPNKTLSSLDKVTST